MWFISERCHSGSFSAMRRFTFFGDMQGANPDKSSRIFLVFYHPRRHLLRGFTSDHLLGDNQAAGFIAYFRQP